MKKLIIAAAIVCAAAVSQAASFMWQSEKIYFTKDASGNNIDLATLTDGQTITPPSSGTKGYADGYKNITWTAEMILSTAGVEDETLTPTIEWGSHKISIAEVESEIFALPTVPEVGKTYSWKVVITGTWKDTQGNEWSVVSDPIKDSLEYFNTSPEQISTGAVANWTVHKASSPIPEPTSGLLLLLGVAGLALRRRRA